MVVYVEALCVGVLCGRVGGPTQLCRGIWKRPRWFRRAQKKNELVRPFHGPLMVNWIKSVLKSKDAQGWWVFEGANVLPAQIFFHFYFWWCPFVYVVHREIVFPCELLLFTLNPPVHPSFIRPPGVRNTHARLSRHTPLCLSSQSDCLLPIIKPFIKLMGTTPILNNFSFL